MGHQDTDYCKCAHCQALCFAADLYCRECGFILPHAFDPNAHTLTLETQEVLRAALQAGTEYFHNRARLSLQIGTTDLIIPVEIGSAPIVIGRRGGSVIPHVDLTPYGGFDLGISRYHASLKRNQDSLLITDLGSDNGTFLNREKLDPQVPYVVRNRSLLQLGKMLLRVFFS